MTAEALAFPLTRAWRPLGFLADGLADLVTGFASGRQSALGEGSGVASSVGTFASSHVSFVIATVVVGAAVMVATVALAQAMDAAILLTFLLPSVAVAVIVMGGGIAWVAEHLLFVGAIALFVKVATIGLPAWILTGVAFLDKGKLGVEVWEAARQVLGRAE